MRSQEVKRTEVGAPKSNAERFFKYIKIEKDKENLKNNYRLKETKDKRKKYTCAIHNAGVGSMVDKKYCKGYYWDS